MYEMIRAHQLDIMLLLCGACSILAFLIIHTRFLPKVRKTILILMEVMAFFLLWFDRMAYIYAGDPSDMGSIMVRVSNFLVFFLTPGMVMGLTLYLIDWIRREGGKKEPPLRLKLCFAASVIGMLLAVLAAFTDLYYYFDEDNLYHRGKYFLIAYIIPVICPVVEFTVVRKHRKIFSKLIYTSIMLYIFVPLICGIIQVFTYGISIVNMAMTLVSLSLYVFTYLDINNTVEHAHEIELRNMEGEKIRMQRLFDQTAKAFVSAVEKKDDFTKGNSAKVAEYARRIAEIAGKDEAECEKVYYTALLHDVGIIGIPDTVIKNEYDPKKWDRELMKQKPLIGREILSCITEYPYLSIGANYSHERYNGTGYPEGLKGDEIPEIARIVAVADAYVTMTTKKRFRDARPFFIAREAFVKGAGEEYDPEFANIMIKIIDQDHGDRDNENDSEIGNELSCSDYREQISAGIYIDSSITDVCFEFENNATDKHPFSAPAVVLFDSYDKRVHGNEKAIKAYRYLEYGELWFDENCITTGARKIEVTRFEKREEPSGDSQYRITMGRFGDHLKLVMTSPEYEKEVIVALPDGAKSAYAGLTGEQCRLRNITVQKTGKTVTADDIPRIAEEMSYIDRMESDMKNVQINGTRSASTDGIEIRDHLRIAFHTMSLPGSDLVWHCPYIVLFTSEDGTVGGSGYKEYAVVKLYGENEGKDEFAHNSITMKKHDFPGWEAWKEINKKGLECEVMLERKGRRIILKTVNLGIEIVNTTEINELPDKVYAALTGDQIALTDIRVK